ncbi:MAG TPA: acyclic terpene utilization AtuA family protein [Dermatophilaceae bacterium]
MDETIPALPKDVLRVGNCSGFYGDRFSAMREMLEGGELDLLTGDYLAELTMLILARDRAKDPTTGYAKTFLRQVEQSLGLAIDKGVTLVANAGGVNPAGLAAAVRKLAQRLGLSVRVAYVAGDDLTVRAAGLGLGDPLAAHAYLGAFGIAEGLRAGADVLVTGRVTDASVIIGPAIAHFGWQRKDLDALAGATVAGHIIECGTQATGGNFAFFTEIPDLVRPGFPIAEIHADGSSVITKHPGTGGAVTIDTVLSQLLYEVTDARYAGPDVTTRLDTIRLAEDGPDRVRVTGVRGEAPPPDVKVSCNRIGGYRNEMTLVLTGLDIDAKAALARRQLEDALPARPAELTWTLARTDHPDADSEQASAALLTVVARDTDERAVGRAFSNAAVEIALGSFPGFHAATPPSAGQAYGVFVPGFVPQSVPEHHVVLPDGGRRTIDPPAQTQPLVPLPADEMPYAAQLTGPTRRVPLGLLYGARSGDKGGDANIGLWARSDAAYDWLALTMTVARLRELLPEVSRLTVTRATLPGLRAINFVIEGILGQGVAYNARFDPQAKGLGEWLRSRHVDVPEALLEVGLPS